MTTPLSQSSSAPQVTQDSAVTPAVADLHTACNPSGALAGALVSVIMPAYNAQKFITRAIESVLRQTHARLEVLVVDDGSTDRTPSMVAALACRDSRVRLIQQANQGASAARNNAIAQARGEFIAFLDADDCWLPTFIETCLATLAAQPSPVALAYSWYFVVNDEGLLINRSPARSNAGNVFTTMLQEETVIFNSHTLMHKDVVAAVGGFPVGCYHEDRAFYLRVAKQFAVLPTCQRLAVYTQSKSGRCRAIIADTQASIDAELSIIHAVEDILTPQERRQLEVFHRRSLLYRFLMYGNTSAARTLLPTVPQAGLFRGKKGLLAKISLATGVNMMQLVRRVYQTVMPLVYWLPWQVASRPIADILKPVR